MSARTAWGMALAIALPAPLMGQQLADRITAAEGEVRLTYPTKPGVCGDGRRTIDMHGDWRSRDRSRCEYGPARLRFTVRNGMVREADLFVGGAWDTSESATDVGSASGQEAADALLALAGRPSTRGDDLIIGAAVAEDAEIWPGLLTLARSTDIDEDIRDDAVLWLGFQAGDALGPDDGAPEDDVKESAVFALSQRPRHEAVPALVRVVEGDHPAYLRKTALFWLGQTDRSRAVEIYETILRGG